MTDPIEILARALAEIYFEGRDGEGLPEELQYDWEARDDMHKEEWRKDARALLPQLTAAAVAQEREACAKVADRYAGLSKSNDYDNGWCRGAACVADHIRARWREDRTP